MRRVILLAMMLLLARPLLAGKDNRPLYEDSLTGWKVWKAIPGPEVTAKYESYRAQLPIVPPPPADVAFLVEHGAPMWYLFSLVIPDGVTTLWGPTSELELTYEFQRNAGFWRRLLGRKIQTDTLVAVSTMMFFENAARTRLFPLYELNGPLAVPNTAMPLYSATQVPAVFVRFDFRGKQPDRLLRVTPKEVMTR